MLADLGTSRDTRAQLLSYGMGGVQATHYHGDIAEKRAALMAWEARLEEIATGTAPCHVVPMKQKYGTG